MVVCVVDNDSLTQYFDVTLLCGYPATADDLLNE